MLELKNAHLEFSFPEVHPQAKLTIDFQRTLRIPDDGKKYPLPPGLGSFPLKHLDDHKERVPESWLERGGVMLPLYQSEALWLRFHPTYVNECAHAYPFAIKVSAGKRSAVTGKGWSKGLREDDYLVSPEQPWLDGYVVEKGVIRQFVAVPLGAGFSVEEQITGKAEFGGIQIEVYPMKREHFNRRFPKREPRPGLRRRGMMGMMGRAGGGGGYLSKSLASNGLRSSEEIAESAMGLGAGGTMNQQIVEDPYGLNEWETGHKSRCFVHLANSLAWRTITNEEPLPTPATANLYSQYGFPWFEYYDDSATSLGATQTLKNIKSVKQMSIETGFPMLPENKSVGIGKNVVKVKHPNKVRDGSWK